MRGCEHQLKKSAAQEAAFSSGKQASMNCDIKMNSLEDLA